MYTSRDAPKLKTEDVQSGFGSTENEHQSQWCKDSLENICVPN